MFSSIPNAPAKPLVKTVLPLPNSPIKQITILLNFSDSKFWAKTIVSSSEFVVILYSILITINIIVKKKLYYNKKVSFYKMLQKT